MDPVAFRQALAEWANNHGPLYRQLADAIALQVAAGVFRAGHLLPAERVVATELAVSRGTAVRAYADLEERGLVERRQGRGTTVTGISDDLVRPQMVGSRLLGDGGELIDLRRAKPEPSSTAKRLMSEIDLTVTIGTDIDSHLGLWSLREGVAKVFSREGLPTTPHEVMITSGAQQSVALAMSALVMPGDVVLGEQNTWSGLINAVRLRGCSFRPVKMDSEGVIIEDLEHKIDKYAPRMLALNPQFHNPTGACLPPERAKAIARLAQDSGVVIFEHRVNARLGFDGRERPPIAAYDLNAPAVIGDSLSKVAWPGLRMGWIRANAEVIQCCGATKVGVDGIDPGLSQPIGEHLLAHLDELVSERRAAQRTRADALIDGLRNELPEWRFTPPRGGTVSWAELPPGAFAEEFCEHAARYGVRLASCQNFSLCAGARHVRLPFTAAPEKISEGLRRAGRAWRTFTSSGVSK